MKKLSLIILTIALALTVKAQTTNSSSWYSEVYQSVKDSGILNATNYSIEPYVTYAPNIQASDKVGGGILAVYNMNNYAGLGLGADYLGQFSLVSANVSLKLPISPATYVTDAPQWLKDIKIVPFVLTGVGLPVGNSVVSSTTTIADAGAFIQYGHLLGGRFNTGACYGKWGNAGEYTGERYHFFVGWSKGF